MFVSSQSGAYVCLRCQSKSLAARHSIAATRTLTHSRRHFSESTRHLEQPQKNGFARKIYPHGKLRGKKGGELRESSEVLPVSTLGKPAEIILLKDAGLDRVKEDDDTPKEPPRPKKSSKREILESVEKAAVAIDEASTTRSIEEVRDTVLGMVPRQGDNITEEQHGKLIKALEDGFTGPQLRQYATREGKNLLIRSVKKSKTLPHSDWTSGVSTSDEKHMILTGFAKSHQSVSKAKYAKVIVERGWQLHVDSAMQVGEIDVYDAQRFMQSRNEYGTLILDQIAEARHVRMHALTEKVLRITGDRESATAALNDISQKCLTVKSETFGFIEKKRLGAHQSAASLASTSGFLSYAARSPISTADLEALKSTTGVMANIVTYTRKTNKRDGKITIPSKPSVKVDGYSSEQMDDACSALASMSNLATRTTQSCTVFPPTGAWQGAEPSPDALYYHDRSIPRRRNVISLPREPIQAAKLDETVRNHIIKTLTDAMMAEIPPAASFQDNSPIWHPQVESSYSSRLGFVYWPKPNEKMPQAHQPDQIFVPGVAHLSPLLSTLSSSSTDASGTRNIISFCYRHYPSTPPASNKADKIAMEKANWSTSPLPEVKFEFELQALAGGEPHLNSVHATLRDHNMCAALPDMPIDVCVTEAFARKIDITNKNAKSMLSVPITTMKNSIQGAGRLRGPLAVSVPIPYSWLMQKSDIASLSLPALKIPDLKDSHSKASYRFVGVEHRQIISFEIDKQQYHITTVESGKLAPRYTELSTVFPIAESDGSNSAQSREATLRNAIMSGLRMVDLVDKAANTARSCKEAMERPESAPATGEVIDEIQEEDQVNGEPVAEELVFEEQRAAASG